MTRVTHKQSRNKWNISDQKNERLLLRKPQKARKSSLSLHSVQIGFQSLQQRSINKWQYRYCSDTSAILLVQIYERHLRHRELRIALICQIDEPCHFNRQLRFYFSCVCVKEIPFKSKGCATFERKKRKRRRRKNKDKRHDSFCFSWRNFRCWYTGRKFTTLRRALAHRFDATLILAGS